MMGVDLTSAPDHFKTKLPPEERKAMGKAGWTKEDAEARFSCRQERRLQDEVAAWLDISGIWYSRSRMDKRTTNKAGTPDFLCCVEGQFFAIECKSARGRLSEAQDEAIKHIWACRGIAIIAYSLKRVIDEVESIRAKVRIAREALEKNGWNKTKT
jgi:hypothetical protein